MRPRKRQNISSEGRCSASIALDTRPETQDTLRGKSYRPHRPSILGILAAAYGISPSGPSIVSEKQLEYLEQCIDTPELFHGHASDEL